MEGWQEDQVEEVGGRADGGGRVHRTSRKRAPGPGHEHKMTLGVCRQKMGGEGKHQNPNFLFPFVLIICYPQSKIFICRERILYS